MIEKNLLHQFSFSTISPLPVTDLRIENVPTERVPVSYIDRIESRNNCVP